MLSNRGEANLMKGSQRKILSCWHSSTSYNEDQAIFNVFSQDIFSGEKYLSSAEKK